MKNLKKLFAVASAITLITSTGCGKKDDNAKKITYYDASNPYSQKAEGVDDSDSESYEEIVETQNISTTPAKLNEKVDLSGIDITLKNVYNAGEIEDADNPEYKRQVLAFNCDITNNTDSEVTINSFSFTVQYLDGEPVYIESGVYDLLATNRKITGINKINDKIKPGKSISGYTSLSVPRDWNTITVYFQPLDGKEKKAVSFEISKDQVEKP